MDKLPPATPGAKQGECSDSRLGVYVHFPWCIKKCPYCDFLSIPGAAEDIPSARYADAIIAELLARQPGLGTPPLASVFFGGGTPSLWSAADLGRVLAAIVSAFKADIDRVEITVECNPGSLTLEHARALVAQGVNRLSLGVQGLDDGRLQFLGRLHTADHARASLKAAIASGVARVSADLIYGIAGQTAEQAADEAGQLADLGLNHLSAYALTIEPRTQFGALAQKGRLPLATEDNVAEAFNAVDGALVERGFEHYEVSNFARRGEVALHNVGYWEGRDYLGLGCGAWGTLAGPSSDRLRYRNRPQPEAYMSCALGLDASADLGAQLQALQSETEVLAPDVSLSECLMLGLRLSRGFDAETAASRFGAELWTRERRRAADRLIERGQLQSDGGWLCIPPSARLFSDGIISQLV